MKKQYEPPTVEIEQFEIEDVLCNVSGGYSPNLELIQGEELFDIL